VLLAVTYRMRRGEILRLRWKDVDLDRRTLAVTRTLEETTAGGLVFRTPWTERSRRAINLPAIAVEGVRLHRTRQALD